MTIGPSDLGVAVVPVVAVDVALPPPPHEAALTAITVPAAMTAAVARALIGRV
jgi:hypothetical protein